MAEEKLSGFQRKEKSLRGNAVSFPVDSREMISPKSIYASNRTTNKNTKILKDTPRLEIADSFKSKYLKTNIGQSTHQKEIPFSENAYENKRTNADVKLGKTAEYAQKMKTRFSRIYKSTVDDEDFKNFQNLSSASRYLAKSSNNKNAAFPDFSSNNPTPPESEKSEKEAVAENVQSDGKRKPWGVNFVNSVDLLEKPAQKMFGLDLSTVVDDDDDWSSSHSDHEADSLLFSSPSPSEQGPSTIPDKFRKMNLQKYKIHNTMNKKASKKTLNGNLRGEQHSERESVTNGEDTTEETSVYLTRSLSPVMPDLSDKKFQSKLKQREGRMTKEMKDMQNHLDVMSTNVQKSLRKAGVSVKKENVSDPKIPTPKKSFPSSKPGSTPTVTKLLGSMPAPHEGPSKALTDFLQSNGGLTGGWSHEHHSIFLKTFLKWKDRPVKMLEIVTRTIPQKSAQEVMAHVSWYDQWETLNKANQAYIRQWRIKKRHQSEIVYKMGSLGQKANLEANKRRQELLQAKRDEEREKNKSRLSQWRNKSVLSKSDETEASYLGNFLKKYPNLNFHNKSRNKLELADLFSKGSTFEDEDKETTSTDSPRTKNLKSFTKKLKERSNSPTVLPKSSSNKVATGNKNWKKSVLPSVNPAEEREEIVDDFEHLPKLNTSVKKVDSKKIIEVFRSRDVQAVEARKKAIEMARNRLKKFETVEELQKRMKKSVVGVPSSVMQETKGWKIRRQIIKTEREKSESLKFEQSLPVSGGRRLQPVLFVTNISKLASKNRRST